MLILCYNGATSRPYPLEEDIRAASAVGDLNVQGHVPEDSTISGKEVATRFVAMHVPYIQPGETRAHSDRVGALPGRLAGGSGHLQELAQFLDEAAACSRVGERTTCMVANPYQLTGRYVARSSPYDGSDRLRRPQHD